MIAKIKEHFGAEPKNDISYHVLDKLLAVPDEAKSLAWIGDTAIKYAILRDIWNQKLTTEDLHNKRKKLETNENLSSLCDKWKLFDGRIHLDHDVPKMKKLQKIKGTLTEAIYGVIFIERDIGGVQDALSLINPSRNIS